MTNPFLVMFIALAALFGNCLPDSPPEPQPPPPADVVEVAPADTAVSTICEDFYPEAAAPRFEETLRMFHGLDVLNFSGHTEPMTCSAGAPQPLQREQVCQAVLPHLEDLWQCNPLQRGSQIWAATYNVDEHGNQVGPVDVDPLIDPMTDQQRACVQQVFSQTHYCANQPPGSHTRVIWPQIVFTRY